LKPPPPIATGHYHLHVHTISKLKGQSALAAAAYRHAELFTREQHSVTHAAAYQRAQQLGNDGQVFDYRRKVGVTWTGIMAPQHTPAELLDAQTLWNTVERFECRKNARLAREMIIALPHQVGEGVHVAMLRSFIMTNLVSRGMIADVAIHRPPVEHGGDPRNWHAHILLTDRPMTPEGFAAKKDRTWNAKENLLLWRKAWADTHNQTMEALGLPHRIDHRSLEAQRQEALAQGNTIAALDLDREPQIHVGKDAYVSRRNKELAPKARRNRDILTRNKSRAAAHHEQLQTFLARADTDAFLESRRNTRRRDAWQPEPASLDELQAAYGRPPTPGYLGHLKDLGFAGDVNHRALAISRKHCHPWFATGHRNGAPSVLETLLGMVKTTGPGHPVFTVTAKDIVFAFYGFGFISQTELQRSLEHIADEEQRLFAKRLAKPKYRPPPKQKPPVLPTPHAERLKRLQRAAVVPEQIYLRRLEQLTAFNERHLHHDKSRSDRQACGILKRRSYDGVHSSGEVNDQLDGTYTHFKPQV
jgi:hypothetical protein